LSKALFLLKKTSRFLRWGFSALRSSSLRGFTRRVAFVTGADSSHFRSLMQLLGSLSRNEKASEVYCWDLGLKQSELIELTTTYPRVHLRTFDYSKFPKFFDIRVEAGQYAWKPQAINATYLELKPRLDKPILIWVDAGNIVFRRLTWARLFASKHGVYSPFSTGTIRDWTHPRTKEHFKIDSQQELRRNSHGALIAFDLSSPIALDVLDVWAKSSLERDVIAPKGSSRKNHRQDQAVLSCILVSRNVLPDSPYRNNWSGEHQSNCDVEKGKGLGTRWRENGRRVSLR